MRARTPAILILCLASFACRKAAAHNPAPDASVATTPAVQAGLKLTATSTLVDGGTANLPLDSGTLDVDPTRAITLASSLRLKDFRVRVLDAAGNPVASSDSIAQGGAGQQYRMQFTTPLSSGKRYALVVDSPSGSTVVDEHNQRHHGRRLELNVR